VSGVTITRDCLRQVVTAFAERRPLVSAEKARKRVAVCLAVERSIREGCAIGLRF
jgi:septum formation topological specificity factor MinE